MKNKLITIFITSILFCGYSQQSIADTMRDASKEGSNLGKSSVNQAKSAMSGFNPEKELKGFTRNPNETKYQKNDSGLSQDGNKELAESELGTVARDSFINNPKDKISWDSDLIKNALEIKENAEGIVGGTGENCVKQSQNQTYFTNHLCEKEETVKSTCTRKAEIKWVEDTQYELKEILIPYSQIKFRKIVKGHIVGDFNLKEGGKIQEATIYGWARYCTKYNEPSFPAPNQTTFLGITKRVVHNRTCNFSDLGNPNVYSYPKPIDAKAGTLSIDMTIEGIWGMLDLSTDALIKTFNTDPNSLKVNMKLKMLVLVKTVKPEIVWVENCPINKEEAVKVKEWCSQKGEKRKFKKDGREFEVYSDCWEYSEEWVTNEGDDNTCKKYDDDPNCTVGERKCILKIGNSCIRNEIKYQCQHTTKTEGFVCGDKFYCDDGSCVDTIGSENTGFNEAVSQLAAISQAGKEMSGLNEENMKAFSGKAMACRKAAAGFSDCCKSSGWGNDVGLAQCNSEEKAIGVAKGKNIVISVGTYCSRKVLGVCLQKKNSYCVFDNKLARIVQAQGRSGQLGIGFGSAKSPDCRGISINELQRLRFDYMDFSDFYDELQSNLVIPDQDKLLDEVNKRMQEKFEDGKK